MKKSISTVISLFAFVCALSAQNAQSSFFLDNYAFNYRINPAIMSEKSFLGIAIGNTSMDLSSSLGVNSMFFPTENGLVTGFNKSVSSEKFLSGIKDINTLGTSECLNLLAIGVRSEKSMFNLEINVNTDVSASIPRDYFAFLKNGFDENTSYNLANLHVGGKGYAEIALGYARNFGEKLTVGIRAKGLVGLANVDMAIDRAEFVSSGQSISLDAGIRARIAAPAIEIGTTPEGKLDFTNAGLSDDYLQPAGLGLAFDLGATYEIIDDLTLSASVMNIGALKWNYGLNATSSGSIVYSGFGGVDVSGAANAQDELKKIGDQAAELINLKETGEGVVSELQTLPITANIGARWKLPVVRFISVGALATVHSEKYSKWFDVRAGATITPIKWLSASANIGTGTFGPVCGFAASVNLLCFNIFASVDGIIGPQAQGTFEGVTIAYPVGPFRYTANLGINIQFGKRYRK
ncbi:MAG: DUF5723 family protein [Bacteroidales bacterium]|nr:DUF5723 family protein [Bacteroidales bacterium]